MSILHLPPADSSPSFRTRADRHTHRYTYALWLRPPRHNDIMSIMSITITYLVNCIHVNSCVCMCCEQTMNGTIHGLRCSIYGSRKRGTRSMDLGQTIDAWTLVRSGGLELSINETTEAPPTAMLLNLILPIVF